MFSFERGAREVEHRWKCGEKDDWENPEDLDQKAQIENLPTIVTGWVRDG